MIIIILNVLFIFYYSLAKYETALDNIASKDEEISNLKRELEITQQQAEIDKLEYELKIKGLMQGKNG